MITLEEYFGPWINLPSVTPERIANATKLLDACAALEALAIADGIVFPEHERSLTNLQWHDQSNISGEGYGGFRPPDCQIGAKGSSHKEALAVDRYDPDGSIDAWCMANKDKLKACGIYIEHPEATPRWSHWTIRRPGSGNTVFHP